MRLLILKGLGFSNGLLVFRVEGGRKVGVGLLSGNNDGIVSGPGLI